MKCIAFPVKFYNLVCILPSAYSTIYFGVRAFFAPDIDISKLVGDAFA